MGSMPFIVGVAALVLAGVCAVVFFMHRKTAPDLTAKTDVASQPTSPETSAAKNAPEPVQASQEESAQVTPQTKSQNQAQSIAVDQVQPAAAVAPIPAVVTSTETANSRDSATECPAASRKRRCHEAA